MAVATLTTHAKRALGCMPIKVSSSKKVRFAFCAYWTLNAQYTARSKANPSAMSMAVSFKFSNVNKKVAEVSGFSPE